MVTPTFGTEDKIRPCCAAARLDHQSFSNPPVLQPSAGSFSREQRVGPVSPCSSPWLFPISAFLAHWSMFMPKHQVTEPAVDLSVGPDFSKNWQTGIFSSTSVTTLYFSWHGIFQTDFSSCLVAFKLSTFVSTEKPVRVRGNSFSDWYPKKSNSAADPAVWGRKHTSDCGPQQDLLELPEILQQDPEELWGYSEAISEVDNFLLIKCPTYFNVQHVVILGIGKGKLGEAPMVFCCVLGYATDFI